MIELKLLHKGLERTLSKGLRQTAEYMDACDVSEGHLLVFDRSPGRTLDEKFFRRSETEAGKAITVWGI